MAKKKQQNAKQSDGKVAEDSAIVDEDVKKILGNDKTSKWDAFLFTPVDVSPLVYLRIVFGLIMLWEVYRHFNGSVEPMLERYYMNPKFHIRYVGFEWMPGPLSGMHMYHYFVAMGALYVFLILGLWYRVTAILTFLGFFYWFCLDMFVWLNHFYFVLLVNFLLIFLPANGGASLDAIINPELRVSKVPSWMVWMIKLTLGIPYFFGGVSKIHMDWLRGEPMREWAPDAVDQFPEPIAELLDDWWTPYFFSWGGLVFDLAIVPLLLYKPTRTFAACNCAFFHIMNDRLFHIGIFPWLMLFTTPLFFEPEMLRPVLQFEWIFAKPPATPTTREYVESPSQRKYVKLFFCLWFAFHGIWPFRHHLYPGDVLWTEEAYLFSWQMKMRDKDGNADFTVTYVNSGEKVLVKNSEHLSRLQQNRLPHRAEYILGFAHYLCNKYGKKELVEVHVDSHLSYNGRVAQPLVYPDVNLCEKQVNLFSTGVGDWIVPLTVPFEDRARAHKKKIIKTGVAKILEDGPESLLKTRLAMYFGRGDLRFGTVTQFIPGGDDENAAMKGTWVVTFDHGKKLRFSIKEMVRQLDLYSMKEKLDYDHTS